MSMFCSTDRCKEEYEKTVGTSTSCSAVCGGREQSAIRRRAWSSEIFGTSITGSAPASTSNCCMNSTTCSPPAAAQEHRGSARTARCPRSAQQRAAGPPTEAPAAPKASQAAPRRAPRRGRRAPAREEELSSGTRPCSAPRVPPPWPWLSSGPVGRCGASLLPGPSGRSSVHTSSKHGGVAPSAACAAPVRA